MKRGRLIVIEGTDGSGKSTQFARLCRRAEHEGIAFQRLVFPQYQEESSALLRMYLNGEFGRKPGDVNAYAASSFYAVDRYASWKKVWQGYYEAGGLVLADRYTTSNAVHQSSKVPPGAPHSSSGCLTLNMAGWACRNRPGLPGHAHERRWTCSASGRGTPTHRGTSMRPTAPIWPPAGRPP
ncbi:MAG: dTMP kinase [Evtepia gabavorous]